MVSPYGINKVKLSTMELAERQQVIKFIQYCKSLGRVTVNAQKPFL